LEIHQQRTGQKFVKEAKKNVGDVGSYLRYSATGMMSFDIMNSNNSPNEEPVNPSDSVGRGIWNTALVFSKKRGAAGPPANALTVSIKDGVNRT
jgi:hypothetical protein